MEKIKLALDKFLKYICCSLFVIMVLVASWQVITRFVLGKPSSVTEEFLRYALIWISMLGSAYAVGRNSHISIRFVKEKMGPSDQLKLEIVLQSFFILFAVLVMIFGGMKAVDNAMMQLSPGLHIPMGYVYMSLPVSGFLSIFYCIYNIRFCITNLKSMDK